MIRIIRHGRRPMVIQRAIKRYGQGTVQSFDPRQFGPLSYLSSPFKITFFLLQNTTKMYMSLTALAVALFANAALCTPAPALEERAAGCPKGGTIDGRQCTTKCGVDHPGANIAAQPAANFKACIQACAANPECATAQFLTTNSYCYLKGPAIPAAQANPNVDSVICAGAVAPSPSPSPTTMTTPTASTVTVTDTTTVMATQVSL